MDMGGECEDLAILAGAILWRLHFDVALLVTTSRSGLHCAVGAAGLGHRRDAFVATDDTTNVTYEYGERTSGAYRFGEAPAQVRLHRPDVLAAEPDRAIRRA